MSGDDWLDAQVPNAPEGVTYRDAAEAVWGDGGSPDETVGETAARAHRIAQARLAAAPAVVAAPDPDTRKVLAGLLLDLMLGLVIRNADELIDFANQAADTILADPRITLGTETP